MQKRDQMFAFAAGFQTYHSIAHAYFALTKTKVKGHPAELLGIAMTPTVHAIAAVVNGLIAIGLAVRAFRSRGADVTRLDETPRSYARSVGSSAAHA